MRTLTVVKDQDGNVKIAQFGNTEYEENPSTIDEIISYFKTFVEDKSNLNALEKKISNIKFFTEAEWISFQKDLFKGLKSALTYYANFIDSNVGHNILSLSSSFTTKTRLISYYKYLNDFMFAQVQLVIDFSNGEAFVKLSGENMYSFKFGEKKNTRFSTRKENALKKDTTVQTVIVPSKKQIKVKRTKKQPIVKKETKKDTSPRVQQLW